MEPLHDLPADQNKSKSKRNKGPQLSASEQYILDVVRQSTHDTRNMILVLAMLTALLFNTGCVILLHHTPAALVGLVGCLLAAVVEALKTHNWKSGWRGITSVIVVAAYVATTALLGMFLAIDVIANEVVDRL